MKRRSREISNWEAERARIIGLGERSLRKSHYPELRARLSELEAINRTLSDEVRQRETAERRVHHLNAVLRAIRGVNQLITRETEREALAKACCQCLVKQRGYGHAWILLQEADGRPGMLADAGLGNQQAGIVERIASGEMPECAQRAIAQPDVVSMVITDPACRACDLHAERGECCLIARLQHGERIHGVLHASLPNEVGGDEEEVGLFRELAADIAMGLSSIEQEKERQQLAQRLRQSQRMEAIGQLAGGVAHDFNNILTAIIGNVELAQYELEDDPAGNHAVLAGLHEVGQSAARAAGLTQQLLAFSRRKATKLCAMDLNEVLASMEKMLHRLITEDVSLEVKTDAGTTCILGDAGQMEQVVVNLVVNASDAMPDGGDILVQTGRLTLDDGYVRLHPEAKPGPHITLTVSDTGCGMSTETIERIFEPFFTTKPTGAGTGLGLTTAYGIVKRAGGHITVYSELQRGTTFRVLVPEHHAHTRPPEETATEPELRGGTETILVCEDDASVRELAAQILRHAGYTVLVAPNGDEALALADRNADQLQLLVTDVIMPGLNGKQVSDALHIRIPGVRTLFMSGYTADVIRNRGALEEGIRLLEKPFTRRGLLTEVRNILDQVPSSD